MGQQRRKSNLQRSAQVESAGPDAGGGDVVDSLIALFPAEVATAARNSRAPIAVARRAARIARAATAAMRPGAPIEPTPEQLHNGNYCRVRTKDPLNAAPIELRRNMGGNGSAIDRWHARGQLNDRQAEAAHRFADDYARCGYQRSMISRYDGGGGSGDGTPNMAGLLAGTLAQLDARRRYTEARALLPLMLRDYYEAAVLHDETTATIAERTGRPGQIGQRIVMVYIELGSDHLADFYKIPR